MHGLLRGIRVGRARQRAPESAVRPIEPPPDRSDLQGIRSCAARRVRDAIAGSLGCCRARRDCLTGLSRIALIDYGAGNLDVGRRRRCRAVGGDVHVDDVACEACAAPSAIVIPGVGHFDATAPLDDANGARDRRTHRRAECRCSAFVSGCSGCSTAATKRRTCRASASFPAAASRLTGRRSRCRTSAGTRSTDTPRHVATARRELRPALRRTSRTRTPRPSSTRQSRRTTHGRRSRRRRARPRVRHAVPSGEIGRGRPAGTRELPRARERRRSMLTQARHRLSRRPRRTRRQGRELRRICATPAIPADARRTLRPRKASTRSSCSTSPPRSKAAAPSLDTVRDVADRALHSTDGRRRHRVARRCEGGVRRRRRQGQHQQRGAARSVAHHELAGLYGSQAVVVAIDARRDGGRYRVLQPQRHDRRGADGRRVGAGGREPRRGRDSADVDRSRRHAHGIRLRAHGRASAMRSRFR